MKTIGIFSKFDISGGSEMRCVELANAIQKYTSYKSCLLCQGKITPQLKLLLNDGICVYQNIFQENTDEFYALDCLIVVNTDSRLFATANFWAGKTEKHDTFVDLTQIKQIIYIFNYIISPSKHLTEIEQYCPNLKIITTNNKFFKEISTKYPEIIHIPRIILESPINPNNISPTKVKSKKIRIGCLSKPVHDKWNEDWEELISRVNAIIGNDRLQWRFLGCPSSLQEKLSVFDNIEFNKEFSITVKDFLQELDIFVYLPKYGREEPWSRSIAEALLSGCPVITTYKGGNVDQIVHGNNGFLCAHLDEFEKFITYLCENTSVRKSMQRICVKKSQYFTSPKIIEKLMDFMQW
jgi:glycosyltransferase involved in cell wall biosynthesis